MIGFRRQKEAAEATVKQLKALGRRAAAFEADVRDAGAVADLVQAACQELGGLDIVVANAGVPTRFQPIHETEPGYWERVVSIDLNGVFHTFHAAIPVLRENGGGVLLSISSVAVDQNAANGAPYTAAKAGVNALTKIAAKENAEYGIRCNIISPGLIMTDMGEGLLEAHGERITDMIPLGRIGTPEDVARLAVFLASEEASWITGKNFRIDGGML